MILIVGHPSHWEVWRNRPPSVRTGEPPQKAPRHVVFEYLDTNTQLATVCNNAMTAMGATAMDAHWSLRTTTPTLSGPWMSAEATARYTPHLVPDFAP